MLYITPLAPVPPQPVTGPVVFIHPDGAGASTWHVGRVALVGPDAKMEWDKLPSVAIYRDHMRETLTASSNAGATTHATGERVGIGAFGLTDAKVGKPVVDANGKQLSVMEQAIAAGIPTAVVQSGAAFEPGTACFVVETQGRGEVDEICRQLIESKVDLILGGGEAWFLPKGTTGRHGPSERKDNLDLIARAKELGYVVVYTRDELLALPRDTKKVLGLFASVHTFNDRTEEELAIAGLPLFVATAPTLGEMTQFAIDNLAARSDRFLLVVEEEGTDNFGNANNAAGVIESMRRADEAIGVARVLVQKNPRALVLTCADSDAGGMRLNGLNGKPPEKLPERDESGAPIDGVGGTGTAPFFSKPDRNGLSMPFFISWAGRDDMSGGVVIRAEGQRSELVRGTMDNTDIAPLIRANLFGTEFTKRD
jgi:alkaline phosphatase